MRIQSVNSNYINNYSAKRKNLPQFQSNICYTFKKLSCGGKDLCPEASEKLAQITSKAALTNPQIVAYGWSRWLPVEDGQARYLVVDKTTPEFSEIMSQNAMPGIEACVERILAKPTTKYIPLEVDEAEVCHACVAKARTLSGQSRLAS